MAKKITVTHSNTLTSIDASVERLRCTAVVEKNYPDEAHGDRWINTQPLRIATRLIVPLLQCGQWNFVLTFCSLGLTATESIN